MSRRSITQILELLEERRVVAKRRALSDIERLRSLIDSLEQYIEDGHSSSSARSAVMNAAGHVVCRAAEFDELNYILHKDTEPLEPLSPPLIPELEDAWEK